MHKRTTDTYNKGQNQYSEIIKIALIRKKKQKTKNSCLVLHMVVFVIDNKFHYIFFVNKKSNSIIFLNVFNNNSIMPHLIYNNY